MDDEKNPKEYEEEFLADAKRRAHEEELEMLANIAIIRSTMMGQREKMPEERGSDGKSRQRELERRLLLRMNMNREPEKAENGRQAGQYHTAPNRGMDDKGHKLNEGG
ncbi:MAG: hypothetical protein IJQ81_15890 [Oscillibacter sp.]|nr:hypothetical protein [Oscillibacter sp.]